MDSDAPPWFITDAVIDALQPYLITGFNLGFLDGPCEVGASVTKFCHDFLDSETRRLKARGARQS